MKKKEKTDYLVTIRTADSSGGTPSVALRLDDSSGTTKSIALTDAVDVSGNRRRFASKQSDVFLLSSVKSVDDRIHSVTISACGEGELQFEWIKIKDLSTRRSFHFVCGRWLLPPPMGGKTWVLTVSGHEEDGVVGAVVDDSDGREALVGGKKDKKQKKMKGGGYGGYGVGAAPYGYGQPPYGQPPYGQPPYGQPPMYPGQQPYGPLRPGVPPPHGYPPPPPAGYPPPPPGGYPRPPPQGGYPPPPPQGYPPQQRPPFQW